MTKKSNPMTEFALARLDLENAANRAANEFMARTGKRAAVHVVTEPWIAAVLPGEVPLK